MECNVILDYLSQILDIATLSAYIGTTMIGTSVFKNSVRVVFIDNCGGFRYERVLHESVLWITFSTNGEISLETRGHRELERKKNGTYFMGKR